MLCNNGLGEESHKVELSGFFLRLLIFLVNLFYLIFLYFFSLCVLFRCHSQCDFLLDFFVVVVVSFLEFDFRWDLFYFVDERVEEVP
jgi:small-conductance mechanosensitive channel